MSLERLVQKRARLEAEAARLKTRESEERRRAEVRRKIIVGASIIRRVEQDSEARDWVIRVLAAAGLSDRDRAAIAPIFGGGHDAR